MNLINEFVLVVYTLRYIIAAIAIFASLVKLFYSIYRHSYKNGFLRERSIDISLISMSAILIYPAYYILFSQKSFINFVTDSTLYSSTVVLTLLIFIYSKINTVSFYKIADFVFIETIAFYFEVALISLTILFNPKNLVMTIAFITAYLILKNAQKFGFSSVFFGFIKAIKGDGVTFIGGASVLFLIYHSALAILIMLIYGRLNLTYLIFLALTVIYNFIKLISLSKANKIKWTINLFQHKKKDLGKKENLFSKRLID